MRTQTRAPQRRSKAARAASLRGAEVAGGLRGARAVASRSSRPSTTLTDQNRSPRTAMMVLRATTSMRARSSHPVCTTPIRSSTRLQSGSLVWEGVWRGRPRQCGPTRRRRPPCARHVHTSAASAVRCAAARPSSKRRAATGGLLAAPSRPSSPTRAPPARLVRKRAVACCALRATSSSARRRASTATPPSCSETPRQWRAGRRRPPPSAARGTSRVGRRTSTTSASAWGQVRAC